MLSTFLLYCASIVGLIIITNASRKSLTILAYLLSGSKNTGVYIYALAFFPGTVIHEISHFFMAALLGVRTGEISLFPEFKEDTRSVHLGSVLVEKTDFIRSSLIGLAPFISGSIGLAYITSNIVIDPSSPLFWVYAYLALAISNTLFTSKEDRRHWPVLAGFLILVWIIFALIGITIAIPETFIANLQKLVSACAYSFALAIGANCVLWGIFRVMIGVVQRVTGKKVIFK